MHWSTADLIMWQSSLCEKLTEHKPRCFYGTGSWTEDEIKYIYALDAEIRRTSSADSDIKNVEQKARKTACNISALEPQNRSLTGDKYVQIVCELAVCVCLGGCNCMCFSGCIGSVPNSSCFVASAPVGLSVAAALIEKGGPYPGDR